MDASPHEVPPPEAEGAPPAGADHAAGGVEAESDEKPAGAGIGVLVAGAGAVELHGVTLLRHSDARGMTWLVNSQCLIMLSMLGYCALRLAHPQLEPLRATVTDEMKQQLEIIGWSVDHFIGLVYRFTYFAVSLATVLYQGGMAIYYFRRRGPVAVPAPTREERHKLDAEIAAAEQIVDVKPIVN